ncbi:MAG: hypothetical protein ABIS03_06700 [Gemmatimonadaceae bacterium]
MTQNTQSLSFRRGQRNDLHITVLREEAENTYGAIFAEAVELRHKLDDAAFPNDQYDAAVVGLVCSTILRIRPLPPFARQGVGGLLGLLPEKRSELVKVPAYQGGASFEERADRVWAEVVIDGLTTGLYPAGSYLGGLTDIGCGLEGLHLTWQRDIIAEADAAGLIPLAGVNRIRSKLVVAAAGQEVERRGILLDVRGKPINKAAQDDGEKKLLDRRYRLIELVEHAASIGSPLQCIPSRVREARGGEANRSQERRQAAG